MKLFCQIGRTFSPTSGREVKKNTVTDVVTDVKSRQQMVTLGSTSRRGEETGRLKVLLQQGLEFCLMIK
jgi:excinuclease ABC subunit A